MSIVIKNVGPIAMGAQNQQNTKEQNLAVGDQGTVRVIYQNVEYTWGPNESKTIADDGIARALVAQDSRLRIADSRDGARSSQVS